MENPYNDIVLSHPSYGEEPFVVEEFLEDKAETKFIRTVERLVRTSDEYKRWLLFIHTVLGEDCMCYQTGERMDFCAIHLHHHPIPLFDLVRICMFNTKGWTTFGVAQEVMSWHFKNMIGFIPLCATSHEKFHNGGLVVPISIVEGNWGTFLTKFEIPDSILDKVYAAYTVTFDSQPEISWAVRERKYPLNEDAPKLVVRDTSKSRTCRKDDWNDPDRALEFL